MIRVMTAFINFYNVPGTGTKYLICVLIYLSQQLNGLLIEIAMVVVMLSNTNYSNYRACFMCIISFASHNGPVSKALSIIVPTL